MYYSGEGVAEDYSQAVHWYRKAADQGNADAQYTLGNMYRNGQGVPQNYSQAAVLYRKAGTQGHSDSLNNLGVGYEFGHFGVQNLVLAHIFYNLAAVNGDAKSKTNRDEISQKLTPIQLSEAQELASQWVKGQPLPIVTKTYPRSSKKKK
jgi:TPR repeat protein